MSKAYSSLLSLAINATGGLSRREWKIGSNTGNQLITQHSGWTIDQVNSYVFNQVIHNWDNQYGVLRGLFSGHDESAVSAEDTFGSSAFQLGSNGLHGCQVVTVVSKRAVWMAHFWESYTNGKPNRVEISPRSGITAFDERMIYFLTGRSVDLATADKGKYDQAYPDYAPTKNHPYLTPTGDPLDKTNFNQPGDETKVFIMTPLSDTSTLKKPFLKYQRRLERVEQALISYLGPDITVVFVPYKRIEDLAEQDTDQRGLALFQYDPNADGHGLRQWRLFYENRVVVGNVS
ncbi:hypothetical protein M436DRAFT_86613 [Aureobasidium namibiae CBS 147.97]|uniref:Uncharacterized protein n=1 Tax=Aureobasidium namibiae CBS 147.97 TaxID=1043004 RepID=A0A074W5R8_9PEZI